MEQFLITFKAESAIDWMQYHKDNLSEIKSVLKRYGLDPIKPLVIDVDLNKCGVIFNGDIKKLPGAMIDEEVHPHFDASGIIKETVESDVYGLSAIRLRILSEIESSIARVLTEESTKDEEVIIHSNGFDRIETDTCFR